MNTSTPSAASSDVIDDLYALILADGLPVEVQGKTIRYRTVRLRETSVADERAAARLAERVMIVGGSPKLLVSDSEFRYALTMRHIDYLACDGVKIGQAVLDLEILGKLSPHDLQLIEARVVLITLAAQVRYGVITQAEFDVYAAGQVPAGAAPAAPQPVGQAAGVGADAAAPESGPAMLADYAGAGAAGAAAGHGG